MNAPRDIDSAASGDPTDRPPLRRHVTPDHRIEPVDAYKEVDPNYIELAAEVLTLLADPTRMRILLVLEEHGELPVGEIAATVGRPRPGVSQHLARLRMAHMVTTRQEGTKVLYSLIDEHPMYVIREAYRQAEHSVSTGTQVPHHHR